MAHSTLAAIALLLLAAAPGHAQAPSILDRSTGATLVLSESAWTLALEQPHLAANARDYISMHAAQINIAGNRRYYLATFFWSTVLGRGQFAGSQPRITLQVDDRSLQLMPAGATPRDVGISRWPLAPPGRDALLVLYEVDAALVSQLSVAERVRARPDDDPTLPPEVWFETWRDARRSVADFVSATR